MSCHAVRRLRCGRSSCANSAAHSSTSSSWQPPLLLRMEWFARIVVLVVAVVAVAIALLGIVAQGRAVGEMLLFAVAVAVSAVPESMPIVLTVALAVASVRMARRGVIVRRLAAVEGVLTCLALLGLAL